MWTWIRRQIDWQVDKFSARVARNLLDNPEAARRMDMAVLARWEEKASNAKNPLLRYGAKYFSQNDEDGILLEILGRLNIQNAAPGVLLGVAVSAWLIKHPLWGEIERVSAKIAIAVGYATK